MKENERADLVTHLQELRTRIIRAILYAVAGTAVVWFFYTPIYDFVMGPIREPLRHAGGQLVVRGLLEGFLIKCEIALVGGIILTAPLIYLEVWRFVAPGLTREERRAIGPIVPITGLLFLMGVALAYLITAPAVSWLMQYVPPEAGALITLNDTLLFVLKFYLAFGLAFQLPLVLVVLARLGVVNSALLTRRWREAVIVIMVVAAIITPTWDPLTMAVCAAPMTVLYLGTIGVIRVMERREHKSAG